MWMDERIGRRINVTRVEQALSRSPAIIATACPYCSVMMADGIATVGQEAAIVTRDIVELVADALLPGGTLVPSAADAGTSDTRVPEPCGARIAAV